LEHYWDATISLKFRWELPKFRWELSIRKRPIGPKKHFFRLQKLVTEGFSDWFNHPL